MAEMFTANQAGTAGRAKRIHLGALLVLLAGCVASTPAPLPDAEALGARAVVVLQRGDFVFECDPEMVKMWPTYLGSLRVVAACDGYFGGGFETSINRMMGALVTPELTVVLMQHMVREQRLGGDGVRKVVYSTVIYEKGVSARCRLAGANPLHAALQPLTGQRAVLPAARRVAVVRALSAPGFRLAAPGMVCEHAGFLAGPLDIYRWPITS